MALENMYGCDLVHIAEREPMLEEHEVVLHR